MCLVTEQAGFSEGYHVVPCTRTEYPFEDPVPETITDHIFHPEPDPLWTFHHEVEEITPQVKENRTKPLEPAIPLTGISFYVHETPPVPTPTKCIPSKRVKKATNTKQTAPHQLHIAGIVCTLITLAIVISAIAFGILSSGISLGIGLGLISASSILGLGFVACQGIQ